MLTLALLDETGRVKPYPFERSEPQFRQHLIFAVDPSTGRLSPTPDDRAPRFFAIAPDNRTMFAANEDRDTVASFEIDQSSGRLHRPSNLFRSAARLHLVQSSSLTRVVIYLAVSGPTNAFHNRSFLEAQSDRGQVFTPER